MDANSTARKNSLGSGGHVHFPDAQVTPDHSGEINVEVAPDGLSAEANLGFLQIGRRYEVSLKVPVFLGDKITMGEFNPNVRLVQAHHMADRHGHTLKVELTTSQERQLSEVLELVSGDCKVFRLILCGRVLGKGKGTPLLKHGIHCIAVEYCESDVSDSVDVATVMHHQMPPSELPIREDEGDLP